MTRKEQQRTNWMRVFEYNYRAYTERYTGPIDWDTALHLYFEGYTADGAAARMANVPVHPA